VIATTDPACTSLRWALALLDGLVGAGVQHLVLSPGSRSTPVVLAAQRRPELTPTPILDERSAAFFALGLARASRRPVALLCTSGSAPAHWLPAVIEAHESGVPMVLLSADRPPQLRAWGANQTVDQTHLFGTFVRELHDPGRPDDSPDALKAMRALGARAAAVSLGRRPGPVHINLPFPEPLVPAAECEALKELAQLASAPGIDAISAATTAHLPPFEKGGGLGSAAGATSSRGKLPNWLPGRGIIVCGPGDYPDALVEALTRCVERLALPLLADPLSGLRFGPAGSACIARYDSMLRNPAAAQALRPDWVLRVGAATVSKTLTEWLRGTPAILLDPGGQWRDPTHDAVVQVEGDPAPFCDWLVTDGPVAPDRNWLALWTDAERRLDALVERYLDESPWCEPHLLRTLLDRLPAGSALFSANSLPIRQLDAWSGTRSLPLTVYGNRGASGIDGNLSTLAGLDAAAVPTLGLLGDLALFHDLSGLLLAERLRLPLIVINNGGGRIFDYLPQYGLPGFEALWRMPIALDIAKLAGVFGLPHRLVADAEGLGHALDVALGSARPGLIEVRIDADRSRELHQGFWRLVRHEPLITTMAATPAHKM
jgi:2-succinyl-5-enolpyruvyl-6-hydroxy-3-cyclohexene-1-carboxylate synthase